MLETFQGFDEPMASEDKSALQQHKSEKCQTEKTHSLINHVLHSPKVSFPEKPESLFQLWVLGEISVKIKVWEMYGEPP